MADAKKETDGGLLGHLDELVGKLRELVPPAIRDGEAEAIHQARVTTRRLKAAIDLFDSVVADKQKAGPTKLLKRLRRRLGALRDADVIVGHLQEMGKSKRWSRPAGWVAGRLGTRRNDAMKEAQGKVDVPDTLDRMEAWEGVREQIAEALGEPAERVLCDSLMEQLHQFERAADRLFASQTGGEQQDPHELRIAGKALRYTLELARADGHPLPKEVLKQFKAMQAALGLWHDYVVLGQEAMREDLDADLALHDSALHREVLGLATEAARRADAKLRQFGKLWKARGQEIRRIIEGLFPAPAANEPPPAAAPEPAPEPQSPGPS